MMTTPEVNLARIWLLPKLKILECRILGGRVHLVCTTEATQQACPKCQRLCDKGYDRRRIRLKDVSLFPDQGRPPTALLLIKRRIWCPDCRKPFSERVEGCLPRRRTTERFRSAVMWACERFCSLSEVCRNYEISSDFAYRAFYQCLELKRRMNNQYPWPEQIGLDEHSAGKRVDTFGPLFVTMVVNHSKKKLMEVSPGKTSAELTARLAHIPGRENVRLVTLDMCDSYRNFAAGFFPNAQLIADKFHVLRLLTPSILKERRRMTGSNANRRARGLLLCSSKKLDYYDALAIRNYLEAHPRLKELYEWKERMHGFYRTKGYSRAKDVIERMIFDAAFSYEPEIKRLGKTLQNWKVEILNYFAFGLTNARLEGFNNKASLVRRQAYGYRNLNNYRLRVLSACS